VEVAMSTARYVETCTEILDVDDTVVTLRTDHDTKSNKAYFRFNWREGNWKPQRDGTWVSLGTCGCCDKPYRLVLPKHLACAIRLLKGGVAV
jgi:hypothetical protein